MQKLTRRFWESDNLKFISYKTKNKIKFKNVNADQYAKKSIYDMMERSTQYREKNEKLKERRTIKSKFMLFK